MSSYRSCCNSHRFLKCGFASTNKRKVSLPCVIILVLFLHRSNCQDKQTESSPSPDTSNADVDISPSQGATVLIPTYPRLFSCCEIDFLENGNSSNIPEGFSCKLLDTKSEIFIKIPTSENTTKNFTVQMQPEKQKCPKLQQREIMMIPINISESRGILDNGYLKLEEEFYAPDEFCIDKITESQVEFLVCPMDCRRRLCVRKCCDLDKLLSLRVQKPRSIGCEFSSVPGKDYRPPVYHDYATKVTKAEEERMLMPHYTTTPVSSFKLSCYNYTTNFLVYSDKNTQKIMQHTGRSNMIKYEFRLRTDGHVLYRHVNGQCQSHSQHFCLDGIQTFGGEADEPFMSTDEEMGLIACAMEPETSGDNFVSQVLGPLLLTVSIFPFLTTLVYVLLWKKQTVHGWTIVSTSTSLLFMYIFMGTSHVIRFKYGPAAHDTKACVFVAVAAHFFFLSTFSWMTVMCCDLWWTFRTLSPRNRRSKGLKRFINYALFGWGVPFIVICVSLGIHYMEDNCNDYLIVPAYGRESCYLTDRAMGVYLYYPGVALLSINLIFFSVTCMKLYQYRQSCQMASKTDMKECFSRFAKLFFVMGVTWIFEVISWAVDGLGFVWYWAIFDIINILRAAAVFIIYVCKRDILNSLEESYPNLKKIRRHSANEQSVNSMGISKDSATTTTLASSTASSTPLKGAADFTPM